MEKVAGPERGAKQRTLDEMSDESCLSVSVLVAGFVLVSEGPFLRPVWTTNKNLSLPSSSNEYKNNVRGKRGDSLSVQSPLRLTVLT